MTADPISLLLAIEPLPRGERLARWWDAAMTTSGEARLWHRLWNMMEHQPVAPRIRNYARPLRLARERLREARAERDALRAGHTCREGDRVDCLACDANLWRIYGDADDNVKLRMEARMEREAAESYKREWLKAEERADKAEWEAQAIAVDLRRQMRNNAYLINRVVKLENTLERLRKKVWRRDARKNRTRRDDGVVCALWWCLESAAFHRGEDERYWPDEHRSNVARAREYRIAMHAAGRGVPGAQPGWEE